MSRDLQAKPLEPFISSSRVESFEERSPSSSYIAELGHSASNPPSLYGRETDLTRLRSKLASGARLITLFGPAGIGKTALAREIARAHFPSATLFADLAEVRDKEGVYSALFRALEIDLDPRLDPAQQLAAELGHVDRSRSVIILDSCDRCVDGVAEVIRELLVLLVTSASAPAIVVTSRELLGLTQEHAYEVGPLSMPSDARALFLARAAQARQELSFSVDTKDDEVISEIVRSLEGIPLALELAASRMSVLSARDLHARLTSRLGVLNSRMRTEHPRQQTMRAAIEWSWGQLDSYEQTALRQLSVFRGGFDARAAEAVVHLESPVRGVLDVLQSLRAKSLLRSQAAGSDVRLGLYEIIREFCADEMEPEEEQATFARHAAYFVEESARWSARRSDPSSDVLAIAKLNESLDNLLVVHARATSGRTQVGVEAAFRVLINLEPVMWTSLPAPKSLALLDEALGAPAASTVGADLHCELLLRRSKALELLGRGREAAEGPAKRALSIARQLGADAPADNLTVPRLEASALVRLGSIALTHGDARRACGQFRHAIEIITPSSSSSSNEPGSERRLLANALTAYATALRTTGDVEGAQLAHQDALEIRARFDDVRGAAIDLACLAALHYQRGQLKEAKAVIESALACSRRLDDRYASAYALGILGSILAELGQLDEASARFDEALAALDALGDRRLHAVFLGYSAVARQLAGDVGAAEPTYTAAIRTLGEQGDRLHEGLFAGAAATLAWSRGEPARAEALYSLAHDRLVEVLPSTYAGFTSALSLFSGHRDLAHYRAMLAAGDDRTAKTHLSAARRRLEDEAAVSEQHDDIRLAYRLLKHALDGEAPPPPGTVAELEVARDAVWFRVGNRPRVDLRRRRAPRLILQALVDAHGREPGRPIGMNQLIAIGWPGERMHLAAGMSRLYVTIRSLRELGLRTVLLRQDGGYLLDPTITIAVHFRES